MKTEHTPTPWRIATTVRLEGKHVTAPYPCIRILGASGGLVAEVRAAGGPKSEALGNAMIILERVNFHAQLTAEVARLKKERGELAEFVSDYVEQEKPRSIVHHGTNSDCPTAGPCPGHALPGGELYQQASALLKRIGTT